MDSKGINTYWYVVQSKSRKEFFLVKQLEQRKIRTYFPCIHVKRVNPRSRKIEPYFPGYIFIQTDFRQYGLLTFQNMPGAAGLVKFGNDIAIVEDRWIRLIQEKLAQLERIRIDGIPTYQRGEKVVVNSGLFSGYEAYFDCHLSRSERVRLLLKWLENCYIKVDIPSSYVNYQDPVRYI